MPALLSGSGTLAPSRCLPSKPQRSPGRNYKCDHQREEHCGRRPHGDGSHVWPHQAADKRHGQNRCNDGEGGENGWIADFGYGLDCNFAHRPAVILRQAEVPHHVLDHHDGVIHENADGEDQGKQRDAVDGVTQEIEHRHGKRERDRNGQQHHARFAPSQKECDEKSDR